MTLTELVPTLLTRKQSDLGSASRLRRTRRRRTLACITLLSSTLLAGFASNTQAAERRARAAKATPPAEANGGNPEYYEVFGKRYRVRASSDGYRETGTASWYGRPFHGRPTSSGEKYDMNEMTAAHTTLPLPTWVEVTNLANGQRIVVKVNDRGPFVGKRVIDLSYAAATKLDIVRSGTAQVEVRALDGPPQEITAGRANERRQTPRSEERVAVAEVAKVPSAAAKPAAPSPPRPAEPLPASTQAQSQAERLFAEAGKFRERTEAVEVVNALKAQGFVNAFVVTEDGRRKSLHRVRVGPLANAAEVERMSAELRDVGARRSRSVVMP